MELPQRTGSFHKKGRTHQDATLSTWALYHDASVHKLNGFGQEESTCCEKDKHQKACSDYTVGFMCSSDFRVGFDCGPDFVNIYNVAWVSELVSMPVWTL
eukprot:5294147-Ditylum_brightwellii.AAC.1